MRSGWSLALRLPSRAAASGALLIAALVAMAESSLASPEGLRACTQRYATWINHCDSTLRRSAQNGGVDQSGGQWCASSPKVVEDLKRQLFAIDALCTDVTAEERQGLVRLVAPTLRLLKEAALCAPAQPAPQVAQRIEPQSVTKAVPPQAVAAAPIQRPPPPPSARVQPSVAVALNSSPSPPPVSKPKPAPQKQPLVAPRLVEPVEVEKPTQRIAVADTTRRLPQVPQAAPMAGDCLIVRQVRPGSYVIDVSACASRPVHAAIDLYQPNRGAHCVRQVFDRNVELGGADMPVPQINFQCMDGASGLHGRNSGRNVSRVSEWLNTRRFRARRVGQSVFSSLTARVCIGADVSGELSGTRAAHRYGGRCQRAAWPSTRAFAGSRRSRPAARQPACERLSRRCNRACSRRSTPIA